MQLVLFSYFQTDQGRNLFEIPLNVISSKNAYRINKEKIEVLPISSHEEADTKLLFHLRVSLEVIGMDYAVRQLEYSPLYWYIKIHSNELININMVYNNLGRKVPIFFHSYILTSVVTPSFII